MRAAYRVAGWPETEHAALQMAWYEQRQRHVPSIEREFVVHHVRDHLWRYDHSLEREIERAESYAYKQEHLRSLEQARAPVQERTQAPTHTRVPAPVLGLGHGEEDSMEHGVQVPRDRGMGWER
jgi:hypothetical protein